MLSFQKLDPSDSRSRPDELKKFQVVRERGQVSPSRSILWKHVNLVTLSCTSPSRPLWSSTSPVRFMSRFRLGRSGTVRLQSFTVTLGSINISGSLPYQGNTDRVYYRSRTKYDNMGPYKREMRTLLVTCSSTDQDLEFQWEVCWASDRCGYKRIERWKPKQEGRSILREGPGRGGKTNNFRTEGSKLILR